MEPERLSRMMDDEQGEPGRGPRAWFGRWEQGIPLATGTSALLGGAALALGRSDRVPVLQATFFAALGLILAGIGVYFLVGFWLNPAELVLGGIVIDSARQWLLDAPSSTLAGAIAFTALGAALVGLAIRDGIGHPTAEPRRPPPAD